MPKERDPLFEQRLDDLRREARASGRVEGRGVDIAGSPLPTNRQRPGYFGMPVIKPPVWTWEIPVYFFIGGLSGMAAVIAIAATLFHHPEVVRAALWIAAFGGVASPVLLILDLGRPRLFFNMLRVFKPQSAMSMGVYILTPFGLSAIPGALAVELAARQLLPPGLHFAAVGLTFIAGLSGMLLATYTGVLLGATAVPAWFTHRSLLPLHFGTAGLGSAAGLLWLLGYHLPALHAIMIATVFVEAALFLYLSIERHGPANRLLQTAEFLMGILPLYPVLRWPSLAAGLFLAGALLSRFGWLQAGKRSALDPEAVFASQR